ncbi:hypothetical protein PP175_06980 [Aneurinibacillus sp. Ricciae_BoGa-3]|uniref:hypothetical protein n=1 Tax=Aneurinibacillus sp. Ricciae_BoGa-3 TaxID=3022697 RepID=UPI00233FF83A|nr:hypothetical protein [Aneurinibacillus sp. Ricciae_BoGa-3]WCK55679.1 hypothetical protein PP175_06980 [Aneurinibacillus sp. Ricciae_BoGa-3]
MKILFLFFLFLLLTISFTMMLDLMMGTTLAMSLRKIQNPFWVMTAPEYVIAFALLSTVFIPPVVSFVKQLIKRKTGVKS